MSAEYINLQDKNNIHFNVQIHLSTETEHFIAYSPSLEVSAIGNSEDEAENMLKESISILFEELIERGSLDVVLNDLGWKKIQSTKSLLTFEHPSRKVRMATL